MCTLLTIRVHTTVNDVLYGSVWDANHCNHCVVNPHIAIYHMFTVCLVVMCEALHVKQSNAIFSIEKA